MNEGKDILELAQELKRRDSEKQDFIADTRKLIIEPENNHLILEGRDTTYPVTQLAHKQIAAWSDIPYKYYQRMQQHSPALLAGNINHWLHNQDKTVERMVRTLDGSCRAFLSNRYRRLDNLDVAESVLPVLLEQSDIKIVSSDVTDKNLFIKALFPRIEGEVKRGDLVQAGIVISNSEVGHGALSVSPLIYRLVCTNGMIADATGDYSLNKYHVGKQISGDVGNYEIYRDVTMQADDRAILLKLQDVVRAAATQDIFNTLLNKMRDAARTESIKQPAKAVEEMGRSFGLSDDERGKVLENLIRGQDYTKWGALNAVTAIANNAESYERSTELEALGGRILDLPKTNWKRIAEAA